MPLPHRFPTHFGLRMIPATCWVSRRLNEGANRSSVAVELFVPPAVVTTTGTEPVEASFGACRLIWVGLTDQRYAAFPSIVTLVPPRDSGNLPSQVMVEAARFLP